MMQGRDPLTKSKAELSSVIQRIQSENAAVGIDAQFTHAVIIEYLQQILRRLDALEQKQRQAP
ncbi:MAG: hypothetical protein A3C36_04640 [Omnitrophica WOR_2 bacterium RIFCSPHIGHO2_02_FULL_52_10]|nr:MAG: hypothetical protein A3C36_04640 [Omnitrophica WOR_2 bacterium RIFCSPHIGHO2_02_FULL_52_10]